MGITLTLVEQVGLPGKMGTSSFTSVLLHSTWLLCVCTYLGIKFLGKALKGFLSAAQDGCLQGNAPPVI